MYSLHTMLLLRSTPITSSFHSLKHVILVLPYISLLFRSLKYLNNNSVSNTQFELKTIISFSFSFDVLFLLVLASFAFYFRVLLCVVFLYLFMFLFLCLFQLVVVMTVYSF